MRVTHSGLVAHRYTYTPPRCRTSQYHRTFIPLSVSLWNDLSDPLFDGVGLIGFKAEPILCYWSNVLTPSLYSTLFPFSSFFL